MQEKEHNKQQIKRISRLIAIINIAIVSLIVSSCRNEPISKKSDNKIRKISPLPVSVNFEFPDTVYINKLYDGKIKYKCILDTITTSFDDPRKLRYITFYMTKTRSIDYEDKQLYKVKLDTFGALDHNNIPFYDVKFSELGIYYIDGLINDNVIIDTITQIRKPTDEFRYIEKVVRATHKVVVINEPSK